MRPNGQAIKAIRKARNLSLRALQEMTGLNRGYLSRLERGLIHHAGEPVLKVAGALEVTPEAITHKEKQ
ncbi:helix-turn-helix domain-containing protein [Streptomyces sp. ISL-94]|uniref:helix-turn-helix domain-containing protein n=1 Tax=Streptomyces sp. ISL-94 TaxID=2819190 RepID=UPI001BE8D56B|nr:helix-turn-helix transcriptional regulator [Streptomyces sp. ISL-94]MBT2477580.1 helix-turn-helix transcriptional regulator [Streptomyces sp. ISL-94]